MSVEEPQSIIGTWKLKDWHSRKNGEFYAYPMEKDVKGQLIYTPCGRMSGFLMRADFKDRPPRSDASAAISLSYGGNWYIEGPEVCHDVDLSTIPGWIGTTLRRTMIWQGDDLLLKTGPETGKDGHDYENLLLWERLDAC
ncbi:lipocalin-like domain-containing protein [Sneathiella sp.]|jgi:hypothetical protein|uniref:lipocalin-like domain-containing protein n=1 Tax=Sneathiella sp. TaxID=1964365 RepID=UPI0039E5C431